MKQYKIHSHAWQMLEIDGDGQETEYTGPWVKLEDVKNDNDIIDIVRSVLDNGTGKVETYNEAVLIKLMQLRNTPIVNMEFNQIMVDSAYKIWKENSSKQHN